MKKNVYKSKDLSECAYLFSKNCKLIDLEKHGCKYYLFVFDDNESNCKKIADEYWSGEGMISAREYASALRMLKERLFSQG